MFVFFNLTSSKNTQSLNKTKKGIELEQFISLSNQLNISDDKNRTMQTNYILYNKKIQNTHLNFSYYFDLKAFKNCFYCIKFIFNKKIKNYKEIEISLLLFPFNYKCFITSIY